MKHYLLFSLLIFSSCSQKLIEKKRLKIMDPIVFSEVIINDNFWKPRLEKHYTTTLPVCIDQIENRTGRIRNFENAAKGSGEHSGIFFDDSDVYKALEGGMYALARHPDPSLEKKASKWVDKIAAAQQPDGYINTYYTLTGLDKRWTDMDKHEMYCAGHLIEAAVAYYKATGKTKLLEVSIKMADHMMSIFGRGKRHWVPGHEEIELALAKLYTVTQDPKYLDFAYWLLEERGHGYGTTEDPEHWNAAYYQDEVPVKDMTHISGHAVRSMYLYCGMADVAALTNDSSYLGALNSLWDNVVYKNMYITGGIGSSAHNEGFTEDYDLPNLEAYCETCASVGMVFWNQRMNQLTGESKYIDVLEQAMYNGVLAGISLSGDRFFYVNPLESAGNHHRQEWYGCACCPSQISRFLPSIGSYIYAKSIDALWVNLYIGSKTEMIEQETDYPWNGRVHFTVKDMPYQEIRLRIPAWCEEYEIKINENKIDPEMEDGYVVLSRRWRKNDEIKLTMNMSVKKEKANPLVKQDSGKVAIRRGPLIYCVEETDNRCDYDTLTISRTASLISEYVPLLLNGVVKIEAVEKNKTHTFIPYYAWDNREAGRMKVWVDEEE